jgi:hypothetical protein
MNILANGTFEGPDVEAGRTWRDPRKHRHLFALRA